jgi:uncharacterized protein (DUF58 family)
MRRLEVTFAGYWYTALTIGLGVVALLSGNNVLYLIESLLLSGMIFSGVLSERSISALEIEIRRTEACARSPTQDSIRVRNRRRFSVFCVEVGEWRKGRFVCAAFIPRIAAHSDQLVTSKIQFSERGVHRWEGIAIATSFPFGLARKVRVICTPGERLVWPEKTGARALSHSTGEGSISVRTGQEYSEGEVRTYTYEDDCRDIVWTLSEKGAGPLVRTRKSRQAAPRVVLDLRVEPGPEFESSVVKAAQFFHHQQEGEGSLILVDQTGSRVFRGKIPSLNQLAVVQPSSSASSVPGARKRVA